MRLPVRQPKKYHYGTTAKRRWRRRLAKVILTVAVLLLLYPLWPWLYYQLFHPKIDASPYHSAVIHGGDPDHKPGNRLIIPDIGVNAEILESPNLKILDTHDGVWHDRADRNPTTRGNMVIAGHRFRYLHHISNYFYSLPKLKAGALLYVVWDKKVYEYQVFKTKIVRPTQTAIRNDDPAVPRELTLYTCTLFNSNLDRHVVFAKPT